MSDTYWSSVSLLAHFNGLDATTTFTDETGKTLTAVGNAQIDTAQKKYGSASGLFDGTGDAVTAAHDVGFSFGSGDFTIEMWIRPNQTASAKIVLIRGSSSGVAESFLVFQNGSTMEFYCSSNGTTWDIASAKTIGTVASGTWYHVAITRSGSTFRAYLDGVQGSTWSSASSLFDGSGTLNIGADAD
jgi:hypothetical protein